MEPTADPARELSAAGLGAIAHLYRREVYRSTVWRTRLRVKVSREDQAALAVRRLREHSKATAL
jgi:hypothetical protein